MIGVYFRYGGSELEIQLPAVPRKDEAVIMPDTFTYRVIGVRWFFHYKEDEKKKKQDWPMIDGKISAIVFLER